MRPSGKKTHGNATVGHLRGRSSRDVLPKLESVLHLLTVCAGTNVARWDRRLRGSVVFVVAAQPDACLVASPHVQESDKNLDIEAIRQQAAEGGLRFETYLPPGLAEWATALVDQDVFHSPSEAVFVAMQSFRDLDQHPDLKQELLKRAIQKGIDSAKKSEGIPAEKVMERLRQEMARPRPEPAVWKKSLDKPLFPEDGLG